MKKISVEIYPIGEGLYTSDERLFSEEEYEALKDLLFDFSELKSFTAPINGSICYFNPKNIEAIIIREKM